MLHLRPYQDEAKAAVYDHLRTRDDNPCAVIPTAGGKTPVMASICKDAVDLWNGRVLILAHVKELFEQSADNLRVVCPEIRETLQCSEPELRKAALANHGVGNRNTRVEKYIPAFPIVKQCRRGLSASADRFPLILRKAHPSSLHDAR